MRVRRALLYSQAERLGRAYIFDGMSNLKSLDEIEPVNTILSATRAFDNAVIAITLTASGTASFGDFEMLRFYNTQMRRNLIHLGMQQIGRNYFERTPIGRVNYFGGVEVFMGVQTAVNNHDAGLLLMIDNMCKFTRLQNVRDVLMQLCSRFKNNFQSVARRDLPGSIVMTKYNNKTYKIDDLDFSKKPRTTFTKGDREVSYIDYYREQYEINIRDAE